MKRSFLITCMACMLACIMLACSLAACEDPSTPPVEQTTDGATEGTTEGTTEGETEGATEQPTEAPTTEDVTTEEQPISVSIEDVKAAAITFVDPEMIKAYAENPDQDWSDFGGMTVNEDGSVKALYRYGADDHWDP